MNQKLTCLLISLLAINHSHLQAKIISNGETTVFKAPISEEKCIALARIPNGKYSKKDIELEKKLCAIEFHNTADVALCAKTWSTSPGVIIYDVKSTTFSKDEFENNVCNKGKTKIAKKLAKFKSTMWESKTSSTYHKSSLAYYHLSRYFNTSLIVPVSVYREIDQSVHYNLSVQGDKNTKNGAIKYAWIANLNAHKNKETYNRSEIFFNEDKTAVQGILTKDSGEDAGALIDGINSEWGVKSTIDFSETPAFFALKSTADIDTAIKDAINNYPNYIDKKLKKYSKGIFNRGNSEVTARLNEMKKGLPFISNLQMRSWMNEITEMVILDTILGQEDRNLNISSRWYKYTTRENKVESESLDEKVAFHDLNKIAKAEGEIVLHRIALNDNDAALLPGATNFMKVVQLVESITHINPDLYKKLLELQKDFINKSGAYNYFLDTLSLTQKELDILTDNINYTTEALKRKCIANNLRFDLATPKALLEGKLNSSAPSTSCVL